MPPYIVQLLILDWNLNSVKKVISKQNKTSYREPIAKGDNISKLNLLKEQTGQVETRKALNTWLTMALLSL